MRQLLFDDAALPRHRVHERGGLRNGPVKRRRFAPIRSGKLTLVRLDMETDQDGLPVVRQAKVARTIGVKVTIIEGQQADRRFFDSFMLAGHSQTASDDAERIATLLSCYGFKVSGKPTIGDIAKLNGRIFPVMVTQENHWATGQTINKFIPLSPDPFSGDFEEFHKLVVRLGDKVPGWDFHPGSASYNLVQRRREDQTLVLEDGMTRAERRQHRSREKFYERFEGKPTGDC